MLGSDSSMSSANSLFRYVGRFRAYFGDLKIGVFLVFGEPFWGNLSVDASICDYSPMTLSVFGLFVGVSGLLDAMLTFDSIMSRSSWNF